MNTKLGCLFGLMMVASVGGCGGGSTTTSNNNNNTTYTCNANLTASTSTYVVSGSSLTLTTGGQTVTLTRLSAGSSTAEPIYGGWQLPSSDSNVLDLTAVGSLDIEPGKVTVSTICSALGHNPTTATATSAATITDTTLVIQQNESDTESF